MYDLDELTTFELTLVAATNPLCPDIPLKRTPGITLSIGRDEHGWFVRVRCESGGTYPTAGIYRVASENEAYNYVDFAYLDIRRARREQQIANPPPWPFHCVLSECGATFPASELATHIAECCQLMYCDEHREHHANPGCPETWRSARQTGQARAR